MVVSLVLSICYMGYLRILYYGFIIITLPGYVVWMIVVTIISVCTCMMFTISNYLAAQMSMSLMPFTSLAVNYTHSLPTQCFKLKWEFQFNVLK